ncbi:MAG: hypothetical protein ACTHJN_11405 [Ginsengibacter sp.]
MNEEKEKIFNSTLLLNLQPNLNCGGGEIGRRATLPTGRQV